MTEKVTVHVTSFEQWRNVLGTWFDKGYTWGGRHNDQKFYEELFIRIEPRYLHLDDGNIKLSINREPGTTAFSYEEFMERNKEQKDTSVYLTQEQADHIASGESVEVTLGETERVTLKVKKEPLYWLTRVDNEGDTVYMHLGPAGNPDWTTLDYKAFKAPLEEIEKWKTPAWTVEPVGPKKQGE